ncbi:tetratricopeptide repeat protein [Kordiimonas aestuarii]|uniref:tetratricopeptide repeat protein n=1 Tax=Kordiimonas aestuarii TaxID=1005925 RepID=UPI0021D1CDF8|nr:tetratricopeptide repeat protein [Kordiimonas aestuarii]
MHLLNRQISTCLLCLALAACTSGGPSKRATEDVGPLSAYARNNLATNNPEGLVKVGEGFEKAGDYAGAYVLYQQALAAAPELLSARIAVARIQTPLGKPEASVRALTILIREQPQSKSVRMALTEAQIAMSDYRSASETFRPLLDISQSPAAYDMAGRLAYVGGDNQEARTYFDRALKLDPTNPEALQHLAFSYAIEGQFDSAVALLRKAMDRPDGQLPAQRSLAAIYALSGQRDAALHIAKSAMSAEEANSLRTYYQLLPRLSAKEQAEALMFDRIPKEAITRLKQP